MSICAVCGHSMMLHDGDGVTEHFACCVMGCHCAWEYGLGNRIEMVRHPDDD